MQIERCDLVRLVSTPRQGRTERHRDAPHFRQIVDPNDPSVVYKKKTEYDFEDDVVEGSFVRPEGEYLDSRRRARHSSLIRIRENFVPEMLKSAEDI